MPPPERFIVFAAFDSAPNAERNGLTFRAVASLPLPGERAGVRVGYHSSTTMKRYAGVSRMR